MEDQNEGKNLGPYIASDAKSFYASVECVERGLDPLTTNLLAELDERKYKELLCHPHGQRIRHPCAI